MRDKPGADLVVRRVPVERIDSRHPIREPITKSSPRGGRVEESGRSAGSCCVGVHERQRAWLPCRKPFEPARMRRTSRVRGEPEHPDPALPLPSGRVVEPSSTTRDRGTLRRGRARHPLRLPAGRRARERRGRTRRTRSDRNLRSAEVNASSFHLRHALTPEGPCEKSPAPAAELPSDLILLGLAVGIGGDDPALNSVLGPTARGASSRSTRAGPLLDREHKRIDQFFRDRHGLHPVRRGNRVLYPFALVFRSGGWPLLSRCSPPPHPGGATPTSGRREP